MEILIALLVIVIIIGAILGGESLGDTVRKGCGCLLLLVLAILLAVIFFSGVS